MLTIGGHTWRSQGGWLKRSLNDSDAKRDESATFGCIVSVLYSVAGR